MVNVRTHDCEMKGDNGNPPAKLELQATPSANHWLNHGNIGLNSNPSAQYTNTQYSEVNSSGSKLNRCLIDGSGCQYTRTVNSGKAQPMSPNRAEAGVLSVSCPAALSVDSYDAFDFAACQ